jgi:hypothetical protein
MIKAIHCLTGELIVMPQYPLYDPAELDRLRQWGNHNHLQCCHCGTPVFVKAGGVRLWHFAHKERDLCQLPLDSTEVMHARALLYQLLVRTFGKEGVRIEVPIPEGEAVVDCVVSAPIGSVAYCLIRTQLRPRERHALKTSILDQYPQVHWLFLSSMVMTSTPHNTLFYLNPTEREFATCGNSSLFAPVTPSKVRLCTLQYLDHRHHTLTTKRGMHHQPRLITLQGQAVTSPLTDILISPGNGALLHPY